MPLKSVPNTPRDPIEAAVNAGVPSLFDINMDEVVHLTGGSAANGDNSDPVVMRGSAEAKMRQLIAEFGFDRLPLTFGEFHGLLDYCGRLDAVAGFDMLPAGVRGYEQGLKAWQQSALKVYGKDFPSEVPAMELYCARDKAGLVKLHRDEDTLSRLGKAYRQFEHPDE